MKIEERSLEVEEIEEKGKIRELIEEKLDIINIMMKMCLIEEREDMGEGI